MPKSFSKQRNRNEELHAHWETREDSVFAAHGLTRAEIQEAQKAMVGYIVMPGDPSYDTDRMLSNPIFNPSPAFIIYCQAISDVKIALRLSGKGNMPFTVRSGGHCTAGYSSGAGVLIDVSGINDVFVEPLSRTAVVGAGCNFGKFNKVLETFHLHVPGGECVDVCIGGYVQGGGVGFTSTTYGMNCDNVISMQVMLADGSIVTCSEKQNRDLWWAMRGGTGGNFGILLTVTYQLFPMSRVWGNALAWKMSTPEEIAQCVDVMMLLQKDYMTKLKYGNKLTLQMLLVYQTVIVPGEKPFPEPVPVFMVRGLWDGDPVSGAAAMQEIADMDGCIPQFSIHDRYTTVVEQLLDYPQEQPVFPKELGHPFEDKASRYVAKDLTKAEWTSILDLFTNEAPNDYTYMYLEFYGGKIAESPLSNNAFVHRDAHFDAVMDVYWFNNVDRPKCDAFLQKWINLMETMWSGEVYQNYCSVNVPDYARNYWNQALPGLVAAKKKWDPDRKFVFAQMVPYDIPLGYSEDDIPAEIASALAKPIDYIGGVPADED